MSKLIQEILYHYKELDTSNPESEVFHLKTDIDRALDQAPLNEEERALITILYLDEPIDQPERKQDKNGGRSGRPAGGVTQNKVAKLIITEEISEKAKEIKVGRILKRAVAKLSDYLGPGYE